MAQQNGLFLIPTHFRLRNETCLKPKNWAGHRGPVGLCTCIISGGWWIESRRWQCLYSFGPAKRSREREGRKLDPLISVVSVRVVSRVGF